MESPGGNPGIPTTPDRSLAVGETGAPGPANLKLHEMELTISHILRAGVSISFITILFGVILMVVTKSTGYDQAGTYHLRNVLQYHLHSSQEFPCTVPGVTLGTLSLKPFAVIMLGVLLLIATPVVRVAASMIAFAREGDRPYVAITLYVLIVLIGSFLLGRSIG